MSVESLGVVEVSVYRVDGILDVHGIPTTVDLLSMSESELILAKHGYTHGETLAVHQDTIVA